MPSTFNEFPVPGAPDQFAAAHITTGPDGSLWYTHLGDHAIGRITPDGSVTEFPIQIPILDLYGITTGPDGNIWIGADRLSGSFPNDQTFILRLTPAGDQSASRARLDDGVNTNDFIANFYGPTVGLDGNLWYHVGLYTSPNEDLLGRITPDGTVTNFILGAPFEFDGAFSAGGITLGPDGALWLRIGDGLHGSPPTVRRVTANGELSDVIAATPRLADITTGPDGNIWGINFNTIVRITPDGNVTGFPLTTRTVAEGITAGPDGNIWFTESDANQIGVITPDGQITEYQVPTPNSKPSGITTGPDGNIWFTELGSGQIGELMLNDGGAASTPRAILDALFVGARAQSGGLAVVGQQPTVTAVDTAFTENVPEPVPAPRASLDALPESGTRHLPQAREKRDVANTLGEPMLEVV